MGPKSGQHYCRRSRLLGRGPSRAAVRLWARTVCPACPRLPSGWPSSNLYSSPRRIHALTYNSWGRTVSQVRHLHYCVSQLWHVLMDADACQKDYTNDPLRRKIVWLFNETCPGGDLLKSAVL